jgi:hypothetical protein
MLGEPGRTTLRSIGGSISAPALKSALIRFTPPDWIAAG